MGWPVGFGPSSEESFFDESTRDMTSPTVAGPSSGSAFFDESTRRAATDLGFGLSAGGSELPSLEGLEGGGLLPSISASGATVARSTLLVSPADFVTIEGA